MHQNVAYEMANNVVPDKTALLGQIDLDALFA